MTTWSDPSRPDPLVRQRPADAAQADRLWLSDRLGAARGGDELAFREVYRAVHPGLVRYLRVLVGDEADDVASETWLQIVRDLNSFHGGIDEFRAWSATIARHRALDHVRARNRRPQTLMPVEALDVLDARATGIDSATVALEMLGTRQAVELIARLPRDQAEAVLLRVVVGLDTNATGRVLGKRPGAVRTASHRGLRRLAAMLPPAVDDANHTAADTTELGAAADPTTHPKPVLDSG